MFEAIFHGSILALGLILPLGVQNVFVFNQGAIQTSFLKAFPAMITASLCDTLLITLAVLGVSVVVLEYSWLKLVLLLLGVLFLMYMGVMTWRSRPSDEVLDVNSFTAKRQILFALSVSLLNPHAIFDTIGVIGTSSLAYDGIQKMFFSAACIAVSWIWFFGLGIVGRLTGKLDKSGIFLIVLNKISALVMWGTAFYIGLTILN